MGITGNSKKRHTPPTGNPAIMDEGEPGKVCPKCSKVNPLVARICIQCRQPLEDTTPEGKPAPELPTEDLETLKQERDRLHAALQAKTSEVAALTEKHAHELANLNERLRTASESVEAIKAELESTKTGFESAKAEIESAKAEFEQRIEAIRSEYEPLRSLFEKPADALIDRMDDEMCELKDAKKEIEELKAKCESAFEEIERLRGTDAGKAVEEKDELATQLEVAQQKIDELKTELESATANIGELESRVNVSKRAHENELTALKSELEQAKKSVTDDGTAAIQARLDTATNELSKALGEVDSLTKQLEAAKSETVNTVQDRDKRLAAARKLVDDANSKVTNLEKKVTELETQLSGRPTSPTLTAELAQANARIASLESELATVRSTPLDPTVQDRLNGLERELASVKNDKADLERRLNDAVTARDSAAENARRYYERASASAIDAVKKEWEDRFADAARVHDEQVQNLMSAHDAERNALSDEIQRLGGTADKGKPSWFKKNAKKLTYLAATLLALVLVIAFNGPLFRMVGIGPKPVLIPVTESNLQKFFMQDDPSCVEGRVTQPAPDTLGIVCEKYVTEGDCADVSKGCKIQLPHGYSEPGNIPLTSEVLRAFGFSSTDPTCVTEPQVSTFQKVAADGMRIDFCNPQQSAKDFTFNAARNCYDYSKLCLVLPQYEAKTK